jgi:hypothetical protein
MKHLSIEYSSRAWDVVMSKLNMDFALFQSLVNIHSCDQKREDYSFFGAHDRPPVTRYII